MRMDSPEDKLLRLIKGKYKKKSDAKQTTVALSRKSFITEIAKKIFLKNKIFKPSFLKSINGILIAILILLLIYLVYIFLSNPYKDLIPIAQEKEVSSINKDIISQEKPVLQPAKDYLVGLRQIKDQELFGAPSAKESEKVGTELDISKRFNLVGIITGTEPQAIVEDKETQKTHYLYEGQSFNNVTLEEIGERKVVLSYKGKKTILVL